MIEVDDLEISKLKEQLRLREEALAAKIQQHVESNTSIPISYTGGGNGISSNEDRPKKNRAHKVSGSAGRSLKRIWGGKQHQKDGFNTSFTSGSGGDDATTSCSNSTGDNVAKLCNQTLPSSNVTSISSAKIPKEFLECDEEIQSTNAHSKRMSINLRNCGNNINTVNNGSGVVTSFQKSTIAAATSNSSNFTSTATQQQQKSGVPPLTLGSPRQRGHDQVVKTTDASPLLSPTTTTSKNVSSPAVIRHTNDGGDMSPPSTQRNFEMRFQTYNKYLVESLKPIVRSLEYCVTRVNDKLDSVTKQQQQQQQQQQKQPSKNLLTGNSNSTSKAGIGYTQGKNQHYQHITIGTTSSTNSTPTPTPTQTQAQPLHYYNNCENVTANTIQELKDQMQKMLMMEQQHKEKMNDMDNKVSTLILSFTNYINTQSSSFSPNNTSIRNNHTNAPTTTVAVSTSSSTAHFPTTWLSNVELHQKLIDQKLQDMQKTLDSMMNEQQKSFKHIDTTELIEYLHEKTDNILAQQNRLDLNQSDNFDAVKAMATLLAERVNDMGQNIRIFLESFEQVEDDDDNDDEDEDHM